MNKKEVAQATADLAYWRILGDALGWRVMGFTFRSGATFEAGRYQTIHIDGWARDDIVDSYRYTQNKDSE